MLPTNIELMMYTHLFSCNFLIVSVGRPSMLKMLSPIKIRAMNPYCRIDMMVEMRLCVAPGGYSPPVTSTSGFDFLMNS